MHSSSRIDTLAPPKTKPGSWTLCNILWHFGTLLGILAVCYSYHIYQRSGQTTIVDNLENMLKERRGLFDKEMEELKFAHEHDVADLRKTLKAEAAAKRHHYHNELVGLTVEYHSTQRKHAVDREAHTEIEKELQTHLDTHTQLETDHKAIEKAAAEHITASSADLETCNKEVDQLKWRLKSREGTEVINAMDELSKHINTLATAYNRLQQLEGTPEGRGSQEATQLRKTVQGRRADVQQLTRALESVIGAKDFAVQMKQDGGLEKIQAAVKRGDNALAQTKPRDQRVEL